MLVCTLLLAAFAAASTRAAAWPKPVADPTLVKLSYGSFRGQATGNLIEFLGIPFAKPPVGQLRFGLPQPPTSFKGVKNATAFGTMCPQQSASLPGSAPAAPPVNQGEDCLFVNVIKPTNITNGKLLPVIFWIYGGGFEEGDTSNNPGNPVVARSIAREQDIIYVSANYRLNAFGFLPGKEVQEAGIGNAGLQDQRFALRWVQEHISEFGGDRERVTIWGESAGAFSVALQLLANHGNTEGLFRGAVMESGSPIATPSITSGQRFYDQLVANTNCAGSRNTLQCLRGVPFATLLGAVNQSPNLFSFMSLELAWRPLVDGVFITRNPTDSVKNRQYAKVPIITGDCDDEGTVFSLSTTNITTDAEYLAYISSNYLAGISNSSLAAVAAAYPSDVTQGSPFDTGTANAITPEFKRLAAFQGDLIFQAPRRFFSQAAAQTQPVYSFLYKRGKASPVIGSSHGSDLPEFYSSAPAPDFIATDALINFVNHLNPNSNPTSKTAAPTALINWPLWDSSKTAPPLLTFSDPNLISITPDTYRQQPMQVLTQVAQQLIP